MLRALRVWLGWPGLVLLLLVLCGVGAGLLWERTRHPPLPPGASAVDVSNTPDVRQTAYRYADTAERLDAFYAEELAARGWQRCGDGSTPGCSNLPQLVGRDASAISVYRRVNDPAGRGPTVEIWPMLRVGSLFVTVFETRGG